MALKSDAKLKKIDFLFRKRQEFFEFWSEYSKVSKICSSIGFFCAKYINFNLNKYGVVIFHDTEEWCKIWRKNLACGLENDMKNLVNLHQSTWKCQNWEFDEIVISKVEDASAKNLPTSYM